MVGTRGSECKARVALDKTIKLTGPGPQLLVFLERYGWEVEARWDIFIRHQHQSTMEEDDGIKDDEVRVKDDHDEKRKTFEFMIGNYCVRRFLEDSEKELADFNTSTQKTISSKGAIRQRLKARFNRHRQEKKQGKKSAEAVSSQPAARMFGEIEKSCATVIVEKDRWMKGLIWYHGSKFGLDQDPAVQDPVTGSEKVCCCHHTIRYSFQLTCSKAVVIKTKTRARNCMSGVKVGLKKVKSSVGSMLRHLRCVGEFQSLDD